LVTDNHVSNERLLRTLKKKPEGHRLDLALYYGIEKVTNGKRLDSREFCAVHSALFKQGPYVKYSNP
jgi:hypothetical protein